MCGTMLRIGTGGPGHTLTYQGETEMAITYDGNVEYSGRVVGYLYESRLGWDYPYDQKFAIVIPTDGELETARETGTLPCKAEKLDFDSPIPFGEAQPYRVPVNDPMYGGFRPGITSWDVDGSDDMVAILSRYKADRLADERAKFIAGLQEDADSSGITLDQVIRLRSVCGVHDDYPHTAKVIECLALLRTLKHNRFRSKFRASLANQLRDWLIDECPRYAQPFSWRQWQALGF